MHVFAGCLSFLFVGGVQCATPVAPMGGDRLIDLAVAYHFYTAVECLTQINA